MTSETAPDVVQRWSHPDPLTTRTGTDLLVLLHGFGANEHDLFPLTEGMPDNYTTVSVRAFKKLPPSWGAEGYCWFPISVELDAHPDQVHSAVVQLHEWVSSIADLFRTVTLIGFSQGMAMATSLLRMDPEKYATIIGLSGFIMPAETGGDGALAELFGPGDARLADTKPAVFWGRDVHDPIIPAERVTQTDHWLAEHTTVTAKLYSGVGHGVHPQEVLDFREFLADVLNG